MVLKRFCLKKKMVSALLFLSAVLAFSFPAYIRAEDTSDIEGDMTAEPEDFSFPDGYQTEGDISNSVSYKVEKKLDIEENAYYLQLTLSGYGVLYERNSAQDLPWYDGSIAAKFKRVVISSEKGGIGGNFDYLFYGMGLTEAPELSRNVTSLNYTFSGCSLMEEAPKIPDSVTSMTGTFSGCDSLKTAPDIPEKVEDLSECFRSCTSLTVMPRISDSVINMGDAFNGCILLKDVTELPKCVIDLQNCFANCYSLESLPVIPEGAESLNGFVAMNNRSFQVSEELILVPSLIETGDIPDSVTDMQQAFMNCVSLKKTGKIGSGVKNLDRAFYGCTELTDVADIPDSVESMSGCFEDCSHLVSAPEFSSSIESLERVFAGCYCLENVPAIPGRVKNMNYTFYNCPKLNFMGELPDGLISMDQCFSYNVSLEHCPVIPDSVQSMTESFRRCTKMTTIENLPKSLKYGKSAFSDCSSIGETDLMIPRNAVNLDNMFAVCSSLYGRLTLYTADATYKDIFKDSCVSDYIGEKELFLDYIESSTGIVEDIIATKNNKKSNIKIGKKKYIPAEDIECTIQENFSDDGGWIYCSAEIKPDIVPSYGGETLDEKYYTISYRNNINAGEALYEVSLSGDFSGTKSGTFTIKRCSDVNVSNVYFNPRSVDEYKRSVTVNGGGRSLVEGQDYVVSDSLDGDKFILTYTGIGNYDFTAVISAERSSDLTEDMAVPVQETYLAKESLQTEQKETDQVGTSEESMVSSNTSSGTTDTEKKVKVAKPSKIKIKQKKIQLLVRWKKVKGLNYQWGIRKSSKGKYKKHLTIKKGKNYKLRVRAYKKIKGKKVFSKYAYKKFTAKRTYRI